MTFSFQNIQSKFNNHPAVESAIEAAKERFGDAKRTAFESQGIFDTDEELRECLRGEAEEVGAAFEKELREQLSDKADEDLLVSCLKEVPQVYSKTVDLLFEEAGVA